MSDKDRTKTEDDNFRGDFTDVSGEVSLGVEVCHDPIPLFCESKDEHGRPVSPFSELSPDGLRVSILDTTDGKRLVAVCGKPSVWNKNLGPPQRFVFSMTPTAAIAFANLIRLAVNNVRRL
jgi:hypothetical protein